MMTLYRRLLPVAALFAFGVIALGAWVRLSDAGLGCPDWPGCYGQWVGVPEHAADMGKAWKEMAHRYFAGTLATLVFALCVLAWKDRQKIAPALPTVLAGLIIFQALLGMWTVTLLLRPMVVSGHLLGGMATLALLIWLNLGQANTAGPETSDALRLGGLLGLLAVMLQIALGGWVSSNYAALACPDFPTCQSQWLPAMDFGSAFSLHRELGQTAGGTLLSTAALTAIHWSHRAGACAVTLVVGGLGLALLRRPGWRLWGLALLALLSLQLSLGIASILFALPLPLAVAHNAGAALLLAGIVAVNFRLWHSPATYGNAGMVGSQPLHSAVG